MKKMIMIGLAVTMMSVPAPAAYVTAESGLCVREKPDEEITSIIDLFHKPGLSLEDINAYFPL